MCVVAVLCAVAASPRCAASQEIAMSPNLANQLSQIHVGIRSGRIVAAPRFMNRNMTSNVASDERKEELRVDTSGFTATVDYKLTTKSFQVFVNLDRGRELRLRRLPLEGATIIPFELHQAPEGKIVVTFGEGANARTSTFDTVWHLFVSQPDTAKNDVEPLLHLLRPGWSPTVTARAIEEELLKQAQAARSYDRKLWLTLVEHLAAADYVDREAADRRLRDLGKVTVPFLRSLDLSRLDAEQRYRIRAILRRYGAEDAEDNPVGAAEWLAADAEIWYALAARSTPPQRPIIRSQLAMLLGQPVALGETSTGEAWQAELLRIREQIDRMQRTERERSSKR